MKLDEKERWDAAFERARAFERAERLEALRELASRQRQEVEEEGPDLEGGMDRLWKHIRRRPH